MMLSRMVGIVVLACSVAACGVVDSLVNGFKHAKAVQAGLQQATGLTSQVGFNWSNGRLVTVTVTFSNLYDTKPLRELAQVVRAAVTKEFKQTPVTIVMGFSMPGVAPGTTAQLDDADRAIPPPPASPDRAAPPSRRRI